MSKQATRQSNKPTRQGRRRDRREEQRRREEERQRAAQRRRTILIGVIAAVVVIGAIAGFFIYRGSSGSTSTTTSSDTSTNSLYASIDNVSCDTGEHNDYHVHAHLSIYINGSPVQVPQGVGIASDQSCFYWLHTHDTSGVIHIESPGQQNFKLGTFFKIWNDRFPQLQYPTQLASTSGWQVYVNGKPYSGDFNQVTLSAHTLITMAYNSPNVKPDTVYSWNGL